MWMAFLLCLLGPRRLALRSAMSCVSFFWKFFGLECRADCPREGTHDDTKAPSYLLKECQSGGGVEPKLR